MSPVDAPHTTYEICLLMTILWFALKTLMSPVDVPHTKYEICLLMTMLWFALMFMLNFVCLGDTETPGRLFIYYCGDEHMHARYYFVVIVVLEIHYRICVQRHINTVFGQIDMTTQTDASRTPEMANYERAIGELKNRHQATMWARFVSRTLAKDRADASRTPEMAKYERVIGELKNRHQKKMWARFVSRTLAKEITHLKNMVQSLERVLKRSWTREEVLSEKIRQCEASGALVLVHSLSASAFARESDADEVNLAS